MSDFFQPSSSERLIITLDIEPENPRDSDPAWVDAIRRDTEDALQQDGYTIQHPYTGTRGVPTVELITTITQAAIYAWDHHAVAEEVINDLSALITLFGGVIPVVKRLFQSHRQRSSKESLPQSPIKITVEIDGAPVSIEAPDVEQATEAALQLAQKFHNSHPNKKVTTKSNVIVKANVPKRKSHPRR
jgi:hypothetical protein